MTFRPKYISFDCYGTLIRFRMTEMAQAHFGDRVSAENMPRLIEDWAQYRFDETLGAWKPYRQVLINSVERLCKRWGLEYDEAFGASVYESVPTWGPHADVPGGLAPIADKIPLVILSNASNDQIQRNVDQLGCGPEEMMHVSSSFRYDHNTAKDLRFGCQVFVGRGHEPSNANYRDIEIPHIGCLPAVVGL
jgi:2-haloacid dehalogenase